MDGRDPQRIVHTLTKLREAKGISQRDIGFKMGVTPCKVHQMEHESDAKLKLGDLIAYLGLLGYGISVNVRKEGEGGMSPAQVIETAMSGP